MEDNKEVNNSMPDEPSPSTNEPISQIDATAISLLPKANDEPQTPNQHLEEEEKANDQPIETKNAELKSISNTGSKNDSKNSNAKISSRSSQHATVKQDVRAYLEEKVFPVLTNGLEELLKAVDERNKKLSEEEEEEEKIPEIHPLFFLARYLMRNAPHSSSESSRASSQHSQNRELNKNEEPPKEITNAQNEESIQNDDESQPTEM